MNWLDWAILALAAISLFSGIRKGFSCSGLGFLAIVIAFLSAAWLFPQNPVAFGIVFFAALCAGGLGAFLLGRWFKSSGLKWFDTALGGAFGLTNALLVSVLAVVGIMAFGPDLSRKYVAHSTLAPYAMETAWRVSQFVPGEMKSRVEESYRELRKTLPPGFRKVTPPSPRSDI